MFQQQPYPVSIFLSGPKSHVPVLTVPIPSFSLLEYGLSSDNDDDYNEPNGKTQNDHNMTYPPNIMHHKHWFEKVAVQSYIPKNSIEVESIYYIYFM